MDDIFKNTVVETDKNDKYYVLDELKYNDNLYLSALRLIDENTPGDEVVVIKVDTEDGNIYFKEENDLQICQNVFEKLANQTNEE